MKNSEANIKGVEVIACSSSSYDDNDVNILILFKGCSCYKPEESAPQDFLERAWKVSILMIF